MKLKSTQKIWLGRIIIGVMSFVGLVLLIPLIGVFFKEESTFSQKTVETASNIFTLGFVYFPLIFGIRLNKQGKKEIYYQHQLIDFDPARTIIVSASINQKEYFKLLLILVYNNLFIQYFTFLGIGFLIFQLTKWQEEFYTIPTSMGLLTLLLPLSMYFQSKKGRHTNPYLKEDIRYEFTKEQVLAAGETFQHTIKWTSLYKAKEFKHWFLLYNSSQTMFPIPKAGFESAEDLSAFRNLVISTKEIQKDMFEISKAGR